MIKINLMMDGSSKVSLRNRQFVRKIIVPILLLLQGSGLLSSKVLIMVLDLICWTIRAIFSVDVHREHWQVPGGMDGGDTVMMQD